ncbi:hypothetical protein MOSE0_M04500 [Monosporozyma servazzii]
MNNLHSPIPKNVAQAQRDEKTTLHPLKPEIKTNREVPNIRASDQNDSLLEIKGRKFRKTQACDRCRLKKIKCDGLKPSCGNCQRANFHCATSDKLSRRGLPKGYTEALEQEVIRLKELLKKNSIQFSKDHASDSYKEAQPTVDNIQHSDDSSTKHESSHDSMANDSFRPQPVSTSQTISSHTPVQQHPYPKSFYGMQLPFINDTFYKQKNIIYSQQNRLYMGNNLWNKLMSTDDDNKDSRKFNVILEKEEKAVFEQHISLMVNLLNLNPKQFYLPQFLVQKFKNDEKLLKKILLNSITEFFKIQNSLIPLLYPADYWQQSLINLIENFENRNYSQKLNSDIKPHHLLCLLIIIQINWSCLDNLRLLQVIRSVCLNSFFKDIERIQVLNLASFFFMGHGQKSTGENIWTSTLVNELLNLNLSLINDVGCYINLKNLKPLTTPEELDNGTSNHPTYNDSNISMVTYWCFEFLNSWWGLIQGLPKTNFISSEFKPKKIRYSNQNGLIPFSILLEYVVDKLNGCDLLYCLRNDHKSQMILENEWYRDKLKSKNLYFHSNEKNIPFENDHEIFVNQDEKKSTDNVEDTYLILLEKSEIVEIQLTLYYLIMTLLLNQKYKFSKDNIERINQTHSSDSISYEILCLYYLLMKQQGKEQESEYEDEEQLHQPIQFSISHILPCANEDIINMCLDILIEWGVQQKKKINTKAQRKNVKREELWRFEKYKVMLKEWCTTWFDSNDMEDSLFDKLKTTYGFKFNQEVDGDNVNIIKKSDYLKDLDEFNSLGYSNNILLKTDSKAIMDQFNIFESSINNISSLLPHTMRTFVDNTNYNNDTAGMVHQNRDVFFLQDSKSKDTNNNIFSPSNTENTNNNKITSNPNNSMNLVSSYSKPQDDTDDGYAEDDDEEEEDDNKPLEIPFMNKRRNSLLHQRNIPPSVSRFPDPHNNTNNIDNNNFLAIRENPLKRTAKELSLLNNSVTPKKPTISVFNQTDFMGTPTESRHMSNNTIPANSPKVNSDDQTTLQSVSSNGGNTNVATLTASPRQQLLIPHMPMEVDALSKTLIKSPFASTLFLQEGINSITQNKTSALLDNSKYNDSLLNQFNQHPQQPNNISQLQLFSKELTPRSFMNIMLSGKRKNNLNDKNNVNNSNSKNTNNGSSVGNARNNSNSNASSGRNT